MEKQIVYRALQTPDGTIIESISRHDYKTYIDKNGKEYMIDGGLDYVRRSNNGDEKVITVCSDEPHEKIRQYAFRSGYGKPGSSDYGTFRVTRIKDMSDDYLKQSINYVLDNLNLKKQGNKFKRWEIPCHLQILINEQKYRKENKNR